MRLRNELRPISIIRRPNVINSQKQNAKYVSPYIQKEFKIAIWVLILLLCFIYIPTTPVQAASKPSAPESVKVTTTSVTALTISWDEVSGASGYQIYRATSKSGKFSLLKSTTATTFKNTGLTTSKTYYYKVRAYNKLGSSKRYSNCSSVKSAKVVTATPSTITVTPTSQDTIQIEWSSVSSATGYQLYVSESETGTFTKIKNTTSKNYSHKSLTIGKTYYYKVRAYTKVNGTNIYGSYTETLSANLGLGTPDSVTTSIDSQSAINIHWEEVSNASGYEVYRSIAIDGTYELINDSTTLNYIDLAATVDVEYYYKIRAYSLESNNKYYGEFSMVVTGIRSKVYVSSVDLNMSELSITLGNSGTLTSTVFPENSTDQSLFWSSSDPSVATVDQNGNIVTVAAGLTTITVTSLDGAKTDSCIVIVSTLGINSINGIDVSKWQYTIDWSKVKNAGIEFAMIRASFGSSSMDPYYEINYANAKANDIAVGVYHYSYATTIEKATTEVEYLISLLNGKQFEYPICVDIEDSSMSSLDQSLLTDIALVYLERLTQAGYYPMIYSNKTWFTTKLDDSRLAGYDHWLAQWGDTINFSGNVSMWQYSSSGQVDGISGKVDMDISYIDYKTRIKSLALNGF